MTLAHPDMQRGRRSYGSPSTWIILRVCNHWCLWLWACGRGAVAGGDLSPCKPVWTLKNLEKQGLRRAPTYPFIYRKWRQIWTLVKVVQLLPGLAEGRLGRKSWIELMGERRSSDRKAWTGQKRHLVWGRCLYSRTPALLTYAHFLIYFAACFPQIHFRSLQSLRPWLETDASPLALCLIPVTSAQQCTTAELCPHCWSPPSSRTASIGECDGKDSTWGERQGGHWWLLPVSHLHALWS